MEKCIMCGDDFKPKSGENACSDCADAVMEEVAAEYGCEDYYAMTGDLPGDK